MSERITPTMVSNLTMRNINSALEGMERTSEELSSGKTILEPSDNPFGASRVIELQSQLEGLSSYTSNAQDGISWENTASSAMVNMNQVVQRVRELLVEAANGTNNQNDLETIALEVEGLTETVKQDANTQYAGQYVFAGTATTTTPYPQGASDEYQGNAETVSRAIGPGATVTISTNISTLLGNGEAAGDGKLLDTLRKIAGDLRSGTSAGREALGSGDLAALDENAETLSNLQANAGSTIDQLQTAIERSEDLQVQVSKTLSGTEDVNVANASIEFSNERAAYEAALRAAASIVQESLLNFLQ
jgi:flagellar hook-associated protein 3 FlgL